MSTKIALIMGGSDQQEIVFSVNNQTIVVSNDAPDSTFFAFTMCPADWEEIKKFVDEKLKDK